MAVLLSTALFETDSGLRPFRTVEEIKQSIRQSKNHKLDQSDPAGALPLLIYQTRLQQTWLIKTSKRLYCVLDDIRKPEPHVNWSMDMSEVLDDTGGVKLEIRTQQPASGQTSGKVDFGPKHKDWLFSTKLFTVRSVEEEIRTFLLKT
jgi:hypothetical protein